MTELVPVRPDLSRLRNKKPLRGTEICIIAGDDRPPVIERIRSPADHRTLTAIYGKKAVAEAQITSRGEIEISVEERDVILAYIAHLESRVSDARVKPAALSSIQIRLVKIEAKAWAKSSGPPKDGRRKKPDFQPWSAIQKLLPHNLGVEERTRHRWQSEPHFLKAFVAECSNVLNMKRKRERLLAEQQKRRRT